MPALVQTGSEKLSVYVPYPTVVYAVHYVDFTCDSLSLRDVEGKAVPLYLLHVDIVRRAF
jgi:hypothetical protein